MIRPQKWHDRARVERIGKLTYRIERIDAQLATIDPSTPGYSYVKSTRDAAQADLDRFQADYTAQKGVTR